MVACTFVGVAGFDPANVRQYWPVATRVKDDVPRLVEVVRVGAFEPVW
jgi:hypothetical protein